MLAVWTAITPRDARSATPPNVQAIRSAELEVLGPSTVSADEAFAIETHAAGGARLVRVTVLVRGTTGSAYTSIPARKQGDGFTTQIPGAFVRAPFVEFYVRAETRTGSTLTLPEAAPDAHPLRVRVVEDDPRILVLTPESGEADVEPRPQIAAVFDPPRSDVDVVVLSLDGVPLRSASVGSDYVSAVPTEDLRPGRHEVRITLTEGGSSRQRTWWFTVGDQPTREETPVTGRVSAGWETASGGHEPPGVRSYFQETPGQHVLLDADVSARTGETDVSAWITSSPGFTPRTTGALLGVGPRATWELGTLTPFVSDIALSGPTAWGARLSSGRATRAVDAFALYVERDSAVLRFGTVLGAVSASLGATRARATCIAVLGSEGGALPGGTTPRRGWTIAPGFVLGDDRAQVRSHAAISRVEEREGAHAAATHIASHAEATGSSPMVRWTARGMLVPLGYAALGAPYVQAGRREGFGATTVGRAVGLSGTATYRLARIDSTFLTPLAWTHQTDVSLSWYSSRGSGVTATFGAVDRTTYRGARATWATQRTRVSGDVTYGTSPTSSSWSGAASARHAFGPHFSVDGGVTFGAVDPVDPAGISTDDVSPTGTITWSPAGRSSLELSYSPSYKTIAVADDDGSFETRDITQSILRVRWVESF